MSFLLHLLLALAVAAAAEVADPAPLWGRGLASGLAGLGLGSALTWLLGRGARAAVLAGKFNLGRVLGRALDAAGVASHGLAVACGWGSWALDVGGVGATVLGWPGLGLLLLLAPFAIAEPWAIAVRARLVEPRGPRRRAHIVFQLRMLAASSTPIVAYVLLSSLIALHEPLRVHLEEVALLGSLFVAAVLALFAVFLPSLLSRVWDTVPLPDGPLREYLTDLARRARFRCGELLLWRTGGAVANAAIVGFTPRRRIVLMTDGLLGQLGPDELRAVFGHEMGHSVRRHVWVFAIWTLAIFVALDLGLTVLEPAADWQATAATVGAVAFWFGTFGWLSRRAELDADLFALEITGEPRNLVRALDRVGGGASRWRDGWRHFSVANRVLFLRAAAADAGVGRRLRRTLSRMTWAAAVVLAVLAVGWVAARWAEVPAQRAVAELRLGRYEAAETLAAAAGSDHADLLTLAARGATLARAGADTDPAALLERAGQALESGDRRRAEQLAWLAALRGSGGARAVLRVLRAADEPSAADLDGLPGGWRARLARES